jgi:microcystin-dependent protein
MKRLLLVLLLLFPTVASAQIVNTLPFQLQNGTLADASQVMANFNQIVNNTNANAAHNGINSDITALTGLTTRIPASGGGTNQFVGGTSSGTNTYVVSTTTPSTFTLTRGNTVTFLVGSSNTGPSTLAAAGQAASNIYRRTSNLGAIPMAGGELIVGNMVSVIYDGTQFQLISDGNTLIGEEKDYGGATAPPGYFTQDGSCQSRTTYPALFSIIGTIYDPTGTTCDTAHFALPDTRGRVTAGVDTGANRITAGGSGCAASTIGLGCGSQNQSILQTNLPNITLTFTGTPMTAGLNSLATWLQSSGANGATGASGFLGNVVGTGSRTDTFTPAGTISALGSGVALTTLMPVQIANKIIKF